MFPNLYKEIQETNRKRNRKTPNRTSACHIITNNAEERKYRKMRELPSYY